MTPALLIILGVIVLSAAVGLAAGRRVPMNLENWTVGGRKFGVLAIWLLMAGEVYTTFTFLGASGWAYSKGAPTYYILIYGTLAYTLSFFILPGIWKIGKRENLHTQPDFFAHLFQSRRLGILVAVIGIVSLLPYLQLQLAGLGMIVEVASEGAVSSTAAILLAFLLTSAFVLASGLQGSAWVSVIKDVLMLAAVAIVGFGVPRVHFGSIGRMFQALIEKAPDHLIFPGSAPSMGVPWVMSTVLLTGMGFYMWPQLFGSAFSAKSDRIIRRNAIIMPLYQIPIVLVFFVGFTAFLILPGLSNGDLSLLSLVAKTYPSWFVGFVGAAGAVTAMVPASVLVLTAAALLAKNIYRAWFRPRASDAEVMRVSRWMVLVVSAVALVFALLLPNALVNLLLIGYDGVAQLFPGVVLGLFWKRVSRTGVEAGLLTGLATAAFLVFGKHDPFCGLNAGFVALAVNAAVTVAVSLAKRPDCGPAH
ncbi:MAG: sodium:solute symporter family protein [Candidatus Aminicenantes bacterium]|nr:sodium:solute symporter family protein [Candidatus Aminicenantes bacterium]